MDRSNTTDIIQSHSGSGDNVGTKYYQVFQTLTPQHLAKQVGMVFSSIREKDNAKAEIQIDIIQNSENLDDRARSILKILSIHLGLTNSSAAIEAYPSLLKFMATAASDIEIDICLAALLRLDLKNGKMADAIERYHSAGTTGEYSREVFYELIADSKTLQDEYDGKKLVMTEGEFNGIIRGAFRTEHSQLLALATDRLSETFPSYNSMVFSLIRDALNLNPELIESQSYYITRSAKEKIDSILCRTEELISESRGADARLFDIAVSLLQYIGWQHQEIMETCWTFVAELEKKHPEYASQLHITFDNNFTKATEILKKIGEARSDEHRRQEIARSIINNKMIDATSIPLLFEILNPSEMRQWIKEEGRFDIDNEPERLFAEALLYSYTVTNNEDRLAIEELRSRSSKLIELYASDLKKINQHLLLRFCENLDKLNLASICCAILKSLLPERDLWLWPGLIIYLKSLLASHQSLTLESVLSHLDPREWNPSVWQIKAMAQEQSGDISGALLSAEQMIKGSAVNLATTNYYAHLAKKNGATDVDISKIFESIPDRAFATFSPEALRAVILIANFQDFGRAEKILLDWFTQNPTNTATAITKFHFSLIERENLRTSTNLQNYVGGYKYSKEGEEFTKLAIKNKQNDNNFTIDADSPLAKLLSSMNAGDSATHNMQDLVLLEKLDPYTTIFRLALQIRNLNNDGSDVFSMMQVPEDPTMFIPLLKRKFSENRAQQEERHSTIETSALPIFFKGYYLNNGNPIKAALDQLTNNASTKSNLPNLGITSPAMAIIDPYTACYLGLTGLAYNIPNHSTSFKITLETRAAITGWLSQVTDPLYMTIGTNSNGDLIRTTKDDIALRFKQLLDGLQLILDNTETAHPKTYDLPQELIQLEELFDGATFSTIRTSVANDIPWLCIDETLAQSHSSLNHKLMQTYSTCTDLGANLTYGEKSQGLLLHALNAIPYALTYKDLFMLAAEENPDADFTLATILKINKGILSSNHNSAEAVVNYLKILIFKGYKQKKLEATNKYSDHAKSRYFEKAFNACLEIIITTNPEKYAEFKLAKFFHDFVVETENLQYTHRFVAMLITQFSKGHFLSVENINEHLQKFRNEQT